MLVYGKKKTNSIEYFIQHIIGYMKTAKGNLCTFYYLYNIYFIYRPNLRRYKGFYLCN